ncbi:MAG: response regulator [Elusimicrobia bacterium]|nr:response regulator [Elusimicrobiota bacterium]
MPKESLLPGSVAAERRSAAPAQISVLLVDDREENLLALESALSGLGHSLVKARSGQEALKQLLERDFAVILLDVYMPGMDGFETARLIRERERSKLTPIIFLTAVSKGEMQVYKGYSVGAVDYIFKPFILEVLRAKVSVFVDLFMKTEEIRAQAELLRQIEGREHRRALREMRAQRNRFFYLSLDLMCTLGFDGLLKEINVSWEKTLGIPRNELLSRPFIELVHPDDRKATLSYWRQLASPLARGLENRVRCRDGSYRWLLWNSTPFPKDKVHYAVAHDITERKRAEESLKALNETLEARVRERTREFSRINIELERSNVELEQFAFLASHDLREPLRKVASFTELLASRYRGKLDQNADQYIRSIVSGVARMGEMISDLLEYSQVGKGERPFKTAALEDILGKALLDLSVAIHESKATITHDPLPAVKGDAVELTSLFLNLLNNAVKFRADAPPVIHVSAKPQGREWVLTVRDNGIGIDPAYHERIFAIFKRLHSKDKYPGTGIGLAICKKIIEHHEGRIWVESELGRGTAFHLTLPAP